MTFILMSFLNYDTTKKQGGKKDAVGPINPHSFKVIFILLTKVIAVQMRIFIVEIREMGL